ncbi:MAG: DUF2339 domain-containing protein [Acidobacteria bacterium]|nr:DUF2339 domain-containing protein [Acidobacteriota bacterium]
MADETHELEDLKQRVAALTARVFRLERAAGLEPAVPAPPPAAAPAVRSAQAGAPPAAQESLESRIGAQWLNRIGIAAVLVGVSYFLKYAFENNWIGPAGRVAIGLLAGIGVVVWSERFRARGYAVFSLSLKAVGIGVLYLSLWAASPQLYGLIPAPMAFLAMLAVTASAGVLAIRQDAQVLAAFALAGGFATPILLSTGQNRAVELFSYVALLDVATVVLTAFRPWRKLLAGSFLGTLIYYVGWYDKFYSDDQLARTFGFATLFFVIFAAVPLVRRRETAGPVSYTVVGITLLNAAAYFLEVYEMLQHLKPSPLPWLALVLAMLYIFLAQHLRRQALAEGSEVAPLIPLLHIALGIGFVTIAIPLQLERHWITIGWFVQAAALLYVAHRGRSDFLRWFSIGALALGVGRLLFIDNFETTRLLFNERGATYAVAIAVLAGIVAYAREQGERGWPVAVPIVALNLLALLALNHEVSDYFSREIAAAEWRHHITGGAEGLRYTLDPEGSVRAHRLSIARDFAYSAVWMIYGAALMAVGFWRRSAFLRWQALVLIAVTVVKVFTYDVSQLDTGYRVMSFIALGVILLGISFAYQRDWLKLSSRSRAQEEPTEGSSTPA